jgi:hypothetical protein
VGSPLSAAPGGRTVPGNRWDRLDGQWPAEPPSVSVIIVHFEQPDALARTLDALAAQTHPATRTETIVVDDGSATAPAVPAGVRCLRQADRGARPGAARNLGAARAGGEVLCFLDADTAPEPGYLHALTRLPALAPEAVTVGRRRHADFAALGPGATLARAPAAELPEPAWLAQGYAATRGLLDADDRSYRFVISAVLACSRWFFGEVGGFAEFDTYGGEDWEWAHRAWRTGAILAHVPAAVAWHDGPDWAGRGGTAARRATKNHETARLARLVGVPGSRGRALRPRRAEIVVRIPDPGSAAAAFVCVDSLLQALPDAAVVLPADAAAAFADDGRVRAESAWPAESLRWPALELEVHRPLAVRAAALRGLCAEVRAHGAARLVLHDERGPLLTLADARARRRAERWGNPEALAGESRVSDCAAALESEPDLEAWVGGWGGEPTFAAPPLR